jgi:hypothetical protein
LVLISYPPPSFSNPVSNPVFYNLNLDSFIIRIYKNKRNALDFNNKGPYGRFDHHSSGTLANPVVDNLRSTYYATPVISDEHAALTCSIAEIFREAGIIDEISERSICQVRIIRQLKLLNLCEENSMLAGMPSVATSTSPDRYCTQAWSRYFYDLYNIDGIIWSGAYTGHKSIVLYERAQGALKLEDNLPLNNPILFPQIRVIAKKLGIIIPPKNSSKVGKRLVT